MLQLTASVAIMLLVIYYTLSLSDAKPLATGSSSNASPVYVDHLAQEQRLAVQIITTDGSTEVSSHVPINEKQAAPKANSNINGAISFDDQYELMQDKLEPEDRGKTKLHPKRIIINLGSLFSNETDNLARDPQNSHGTKMIIGFSPSAATSSAGQTEGKKQPAPKLAKSSSSRDSQSLAPRGIKSMRNAVMDAIREQGGVPTLVVDGSELGAKSKSRLPRIQFMVNTEEEPAPVAARAESSRSFESTGDSMSLKAAQNEASLRDQVDGLSSELDFVPASLDGTARHIDEQYSIESNVDEEQATQETDGGVRSLHQQRDPSRFYYDRLDASSSLQLGEQVEENPDLVDSSRAYASETNELESTADDGRESSESGQVEDVQSAGEHPSRKVDLTGSKASNSERVKKSFTLNSSQASNLNQAREQLRPQQNSPESARQLGTGEMSTKQAASTTDNKRQLSKQQQFARPKSPPTESSRQVSAAKQQVAPKQPQRPSAASPNSRDMDERVARILDQLKLYTTKDQLMKVARDLEAYPSRPDVEDDNDERSTGKAIGKGSLEAPIKHKNPEKSGSERAELIQGRNKVPAPILFGPEESQRSDEVDSAGSELVSADSSPESDESRNSDIKGGIELLDKFLLRQREIRSMPRLEDEQQLEDQGESEGPTDQEVGSSSEASQEESGQSELSGPAKVGDEDVRDYTSNSDLLNIMQSNERAHETDESQNQNSYAYNPSTSDASSSSLPDDSKTRSEDEVKEVEQSLDKLADRNRQSGEVQA